MEIKTKYNIKDKVFFILENKVREASIVGIMFKEGIFLSGRTPVPYEEKELIVYTLAVVNGDAIQDIQEPLIFATKQDLINSF